MINNKELIEFGKQQIEILKDHVKNAKSDYERQDWQNWLDEFVYCLKTYYNTEVDQ